MGIKSFINYFTKHEFVRFVIIGTIVTLLDWCWFYLFSIKLNIYYQVALVISFCISTTTSFFLSKMFTYKNKSKNFSRQFVMFFSISSVSLLITMAIMYFFVQIILFEKMFSRVITTGIVLFINYFMHKNITFRKGKKSFDDESYI